jgi:hypothetical protein
MLTRTQDSCASAGSIKLRFARTRAYNRCLYYFSAALFPGVMKSI